MEPGYRYIPTAKRGRNNENNEAPFGRTAVATEFNGNHQSWIAADYQSENWGKEVDPQLKLLIKNISHLFFSLFFRKLETKKNEKEFQERNKENSKKNSAEIGMTFEHGMERCCMEY